MIRELRRPITAEMVIQEINRYADSEFRYGDRSDEAAIEAWCATCAGSEEAKRRYLAERGPADAGLLLGLLLPALALGCWAGSCRASSGHLARGACVRSSSSRLRQR
jgi:hypothetical protein